uniref:Phytochrome n=1 Tax=Welwitschia mirabilis TaxID=3377 RepID=A0A059UGL1_WELMI|nr:phytochrome [Welwitschia mirabilis]|eukprot:TRINITY_DN5525_c0_g2_i2.p1 TRINITY_DN5525_c0_g2~~TRINITY_DN5525_c0_g2_i2.p1  ORF type:complete len:1146 (-),score=239.03 TRINITY_DN5525_c0_g2_i2:272-3709(-)
MRSGGNGGEGIGSSSSNNNRLRKSRSKSSSNTVASNRAMAMAQYNADARLHHVFEESGESGKSFDYTRSLKSSTESVPEQQITAYLSRMQRGGTIQPFGCMLAAEESTFTVIAYSENAPEMLDLPSHTQSVPQHNSETEGNGLCLTIGTDLRSLFTRSSAISLEKVAMAQELSLLNPILVQSKTTCKPFYAIVHRIDVGIVIDLEPVRAGDSSLSVAGAVQSQKLAVRAISRLQSLPAGNIGLLCDTVVEDVRELTGYDRVMVYKFHEDEHGEVVSEIRRSDLEPYLGLHYPATDIPQASRFLFMQNRVRMIYDCRANPVKVIQSKELKQPLCLVGSTLRAPHGCHAQYMANMGSVASLAMAVIVNVSEEEAGGSSGRNTMRLWGLIVCHHTSPRAVPFPLRYACEFLMQAFGLQLNMELQLAAQLTEKNILKTQTLLCDMLLRDAPVGIVTQSPSIMDLVKCDGAALYYGGMCWLLGVTPTEAQIKDIADWLLECHADSTGLTTDSLADAGYPGAASLGDAVCGMAAARITSKDFLFWFRSHTAKEIKWGGAKHHPDDKDDGRKMHPRSSFKAFLEVVKRRSLPWENVEIDAIHSLQLILRGSFQDIDDSNNKTMVHSRLHDLRLQGLDELSCVASEMVRLIETATAPIFAVDTNGLINGWNAKVAELTGLPVDEAMGKSLVHHVIFEEYITTVENMLFKALRGDEDKNIEMKLKTFGNQRQKDAVFLIVNACSSRDYSDNIVGVCFVGQDVTSQKIVMDKFVKIEGDYKAIVDSLNPLIPPIFAYDESTCCSEWNAAMEKLTGWSRDEVMGKMLIGEIFGGRCHLRGHDTLTKFTIVLHSAINGQEIDKFPFAFFNRQGKYIESLLTANKKTDADGKITGAFCFLQTASPELQQALEIQRQQEKKCYARLKELAYLKQEMKYPLFGIMFARKLLLETDLTEDQKQIIETSESCERQMQKIMGDTDLESIEEGYMELDTVEFALGNVIDAVVSQGMIVQREKGLQLIRDIPGDVKMMCLYGDQIRLQQILSDFFLNAIHFTPSSDGWVAIKVSPSTKQLGGGLRAVHLEFRITHPGPGLPDELVQDLFERTRWSTQEGVGLSMCRKLLLLMNGEVQYIREPDKCYFLVNLELPVAQREDEGSAK